MDNRAAARWAPIFVVAALLAGGAVAAARSTPRLIPVTPDRDLPTPDPQRTITATPDADPTGGLTDRGGGAGMVLPNWVGTAVAVFCLVVVAAVVGLLVWSVLRDRLRVRSAPLVPESAEPAVVAADEVVAALDAGLIDLSDSDADPRLAVIACWVRLEEAAAAAGTPRHPEDTPTDLVARVLAGHRVSRSVLDDFAAVFREARYATHPVSERTRADAVRALGLLRSELTGAVAR
jgi:hypothetical protein